MKKYRERIKNLLDHNNGIAEKHECCYCGLNLTGSIFQTVEHIIPISKGGSNSPRNIRKCCSGCNHMRANLPLNVFHTHIEQLSINNPNDTRLKKMLDNLKWHISYANACEMALKEK